jgi:hypothetical protein
MTDTPITAVPEQEIVDDRSYFAGQFRILKNGQDETRALMSELSAAAKLTAEASARLVCLVDDSLKLSTTAIEVTRALAELDFRVSLIEMKLKMNRGILPE